MLSIKAQLNARMGDFTIVFSVVSGGFFLLFVSVLLINTLKGPAKEQRVEHIPDTPENVAKALFGIRPDGKKVKDMKR